MEVQFQRSSGAAQEIYKNDYILKSVADTDKLAVKNSGFWYDINGTLFPVGSVFSTVIVNEAPPMGPSLGLANF